MDPGTGSGTLAVSNPHGMSSRLRASVAWQYAAAAPGVTYSATGLPAGLSMSANGVISRAATVTGTTTVTVTAKDSTGATGLATFVWTAT